MSPRSTAPKVRTSTLCRLVAVFSRVQMSPPASKTPASKSASKDGSSIRARWIVGALGVLMLFVAIALLGYQLFSTSDLATLTATSGKSERDFASSVQQWEAANVGDRFNVGDGARTDADADAEFRLLNGATLKLLPSSVIRFTQDENSGRLGVDVSVGSADIQSGSGEVTLDSVFGAIVLEPNSAVTLNRNGETLTVDVEVGSIQLGRQGRTIGPGQQVELEFGGLILEPVEEPEPEPELDAGAPDELPEVEVGDGVDYADVLVTAGASFVVHDPSPPTAIGFQFADLCDGPARLTSGKQKTEGIDLARLRFPRGSHRYELRCLDQPEAIAARGNVRIIQDAGNRQLPNFTPTASVLTDGRTYTVMYQNRLPRVTVSWPTAPEASAFTLRVGGRLIKTTSPSYTVSSLSRGTHQVVFAAETVPPRQSRSTTIEVRYDTQAPAARVATPVDVSAGPDVNIEGQALPGWQVSIAGKPVPLGSGNKFSTQADGRGPIAIAFSHPARGTHYYLRRPQASP